MSIDFIFNSSLNAVLQVTEINKLVDCFYKCSIHKSTNARAYVRLCSLWCATSRHNDDGSIFVFVWDAHAQWSARPDSNLFVCLFMIADSTRATVYFSCARTESII